MRRSTELVTSALLALAAAVPGAHAQTPVSGEVRQIVSFSFQAGSSSDAIAIYRDEVLPLYAEADDILSVRIFREAESPVPVDLAIVRSFRGMSGMDASNEALGRIARARGASIGALYGRLSALSRYHTDEFVEMFPESGSGDPSATRLTAFVRYRVSGERADEWEAAVREAAKAERHSGIASASGRLLISDGWSHLRLVGFESLGAYHDYTRRLRVDSDLRRLALLADAVSVQILVTIDELSVR